MSVRLCTWATFVKKNFFSLSGIDSFDTVGLYLLTFRILEPHQFKYILTSIALL